jgi:carboxymethylenebutenolidase
MHESERHRAMTTPTPRRDLHRDRQTLRFEGADIPVYVARPAAPPALTVLVFGAIWSVTPHIEDLCRQLAVAGYGAVAPCLFRNAGIPARSAPPEVLGQTFLDFDDRRCIRDLRATAQAARRGEFGFAPGKLVPLGFCLGGRFAHYLGAFDNTCAGLVNFYGRLRFARQDTKPFLPAEVTGLVEIPYLGHFAETDALIPLADVEELRAALAGRAVPHQVIVYEGARHGFVDPERPTEHDPAAAARAWNTTLEFLKGLAA